jgi:hypothetical protein
MKLYNCDGYWKDTKEPFTNVTVCDVEWDGFEDAKDQDIFYYSEGEPIVGDYFEFVITSVEEIK